MPKLEIKARKLYPYLKMGHCALIFGYGPPLHRMDGMKDASTYGMGDGVAMKLWLDGVSILRRVGSQRTH